ncbi:MAG: autoinducer binding domain-containing protein [Thalassolituus oleivorans]|uniref:PA1136 family autoinducer-binding transcriptional regulator n=1 Tax=Thalassolituus oleivorans TaxID=187493 RepID=UPI001B677A8D|nr:PA1136 family autoinducer-binding transcriptional regulator [Thalassolituus oleivorans]MBQ0725799.1 autoinducer binding domain-containing protein [Thalassolituus oleivorans]MBQ0780928.1 autoinducer binding domain-containing protein [Thalassolituus oleivorans]
MDSHDALTAAIAIEACQSLTAIQTAVRRFAGQLGYDRFVLFSASATLDGIVEQMYWIEGDWFDDGREVDALTYARHCPVTHHILKISEPFFWTKEVGCQGESYRVVQTPRGKGIHGLQVPIFGRLGLEGAMSAGGARIDASPGARLGMSMVSRAAFFAARKLLEVPQDEVSGSLTLREREVLARTAAGWRQAEIADSLGLSKRTVENHLRNVRRRLGVTTTAEAIGAAIRSGEIEG